LLPAEVPPIFHRSFEFMKSRLWRYVCQSGLQDGKNTEKKPEGLSGKKKKKVEGRGLTNPKKGVPGIQ